MHEDAALLFANEAFYAAFARRDIEAMDQVWSQNAAVACIHPGWHMISGRELVMTTWTAILSGPPSGIAFEDAHCFLHGDTGIVVCREVVGENSLIATNIFVREGKIWKMVHHQGGPLPPE